MEKYLSTYFSVLENLYGPSRLQTAGVYLDQMNGGEPERRRYRLDPETVPDETEYEQLQGLRRSQDGSECTDLIGCKESGPSQSWDSWQGMKQRCHEKSEIRAC